MYVGAHGNSLVARGLRIRRRFPKSSITYALIDCSEDFIKSVRYCFFRKTCLRLTKVEVYIWSGRANFARSGTESWNELNKHSVKLGHYQISCLENFPSPTIPNISLLLPESLKETAEEDSEKTRHMQINNLQEKLQNFCSKEHSICREICLCTSMRIGCLSDRVWEWMFACRLLIFEKWLGLHFDRTVIRNQSGLFLI